jgi:hypothetical protein
VRAGVLAKVLVLIQGNYCVLVADRQEGGDILRKSFPVSSGAVRMDEKLLETRFVDTQLPEA